MNLFSKKKGLTVLLMVFVTIIQVSVAYAQNTPANIEKLIRAIQIIEFAYVNPVDDSKLVEDAIRGMLRELDPHSVYMSAEELREANEPLLGSFDGIGVQFNLINDTIVVVSPVPGGPSEKVGIMPGDKIVTINGERSAGADITNNFVLERLRGARGTQVIVGIHRRGTPKIIEFNITRDRIPINSLDAAYMATPEIGYIKINRFSRTTMQEFREAANKLKAQGMKHMILDLNYNSGGFLDVANDLADQFLDKGKLVVYTEGNASPTQRFNSTAAGIFEQGKLVILINEGSASASEIVAGAIQDWDRGLLVGRRSFGKGLVQRPFELPDGSAIRLTTARYHTPTGRSIQRPFEDGAEKYFNDLMERLRSGELVSSKNITFPDSLRYLTLRNKREVFGGGGIMPDFFIPLDTNMVSDYFENLLRSGAFNTFSIQYANDNRAELLSKYPTLENFINDFEVDAKLLAQLNKHAQQAGIISNEKEGKSDELLENRLKALIARSLWDFSAFIQISMQMDEAFLKAIKIIEDDTFKTMDIHYR